MSFHIVTTQLNNCVLLANCGLPSYCYCTLLPSF